MWEFQWPWVGILIPCVLIAAIAYGSHFFVFRHHMALVAQAQYQLLVSLVWVTYIMAIYTPPGSPGAGCRTKQHSWQKWCKKCRMYKPERAHHCRKCGVCVLGMDHHCPWLNNCVGFGNTAHFMRFLVCTETALFVTLWHLARRLAVYYENMHYPAYLLRRAEMGAVLVLFPTAAFCFGAILLLFIRCVVHLVSGKTQIEVWEYERIAAQFHTERLWRRIRANYRSVHGSEMGPLVSWSRNLKEYADEGENHEREVDSDSVASSPRDCSDPVVPPNFSPDDLVFPYDMGVLQNLTNALGPVYTWVLPWGRPKGNGMDFPKNDDDDQLNLPWPPDGGPDDFVLRIYTDDELREMKDVALIKKHLDPRSHMSRVDWTNDMGEGLADYGVDLDADKEE